MGSTNVADAKGSADESANGNNLFDQSVQEACAIMSVRLSEATEDSFDIDWEDPQAEVDAWRRVVDAYGSLEKTISNPEVSAAVAAHHENMTAWVELMQKFRVDEDLNVMDELQTAVTASEESEKALYEICS